MGLMGSAAVQGRVQITPDRDRESAAGAFSAFFEKEPEPPAVVEDESAPQDDLEEDETAQDVSDFSESGAILACPLPEAASQDAIPFRIAGSDGLSTSKSAVIDGISDAGADGELASAGTLSASSGEDAIALLSGAPAEGGAGNDQAETNSVRDAPAEQVAADRPTQSPVASNAGLDLSRDPSAVANSQTFQKKSPQSDQKVDGSDVRQVLDLSGQAAFAVSVNESRSATPPDIHGGARLHSGPAETQHVLRQLGERLSQGAEGVVEIALSPEELGKVRMVITAGERPAVTVFSDRPETHDLLRRNADALDKELRNAGIFGADISFSGGNDRKDQRNATGGGLRGMTENDRTMSLDPRALPTRHRPITDRRIDIRI